MSGFKIFDYLIVMLAVPVGFFVGIATLLLADLFGVSVWIAMPIVLLAVAIFVGANQLLDMLFWGGMERAAKAMGAKTGDREVVRKWEAWHRRAGRLAFGLGIVIAFIAAQFVEPLTIMEYF